MDLFEANVNEFYSNVGRFSYTFLKFSVKKGLQQIFVAKMKILIPKNTAF